MYILLFQTVNLIKVETDCNPFSMISILIPLLNQIVFSAKAATIRDIRIALDVKI